MATRNERRLYSLLNYYRSATSDIFEKCRSFKSAFDSIDHDGTLRDSHRVPLMSGLDARVQVRSPVSGASREILCFDSNGYLGLQHHGEVKSAVREAIEVFGAGTPSVPLLGGTNSLIRRLEETVASFHGREDAMIFSSAYAANLSLTPALVREDDYIFFDECVHASTIQGIQLAKCRKSISYRSGDVADLEAKILALGEDRDRAGLLVLTEGVFSMKGDRLALPQFKEVCRRYGARLIVDECHSIGVLGSRGRGIEDHFNLPGACDLIVGCFSKALGFSGGYITGPREVILYLRYFAGAYVFSTSLPAPQCAGLIRCFELIDEEPAWLERLRENSDLFRVQFRNLGFFAPEEGGAIFKISIPGNRRLFEVGRDLLAHGLKVGIVTYPAVRENHGLLRIVVTARHSRADIEEAMGILRTTLSQHGLLPRAQNAGESLSHQPEQR